MNALDIYKRPFRTDGVFIWSSNDVMALMVADCINNPERLMERTCQIINGESKSIGNPNITYSNGDIYNGANLLMVVRGFGHLTSTSGLNLSAENAIKIQDEFGEYICKLLRNEQ